MVRIFNYARNLALAALLIVLSGAGLSVEAKKHRQIQPGNYLVPPPPAYMPSILPELRGSSSGQAAGHGNPYRKYVYSADGYADPTPVKTHKTVTYWQPEASPVVNR